MIPYVRRALLSSRLPTILPGTIRNQLHKYSTKNGAHVETGQISEEPLLDKFSRQHNYLRISLTEKCNLRCQYCMPAEGVPLKKRDELLTSDEIIQLVKIFASLGVDKIRLTGGEPTVRRDIVELLHHIKDIPGIKVIAMTTNGLTLTRQLVALQRAGLNLLNISLDTLHPQRYQEMARRPGFERVVAGIDLAIQLGYKPKVNCVLMKNFNLDELCEFVHFTKDRNVDMRFIEFMPFTGNKWDDQNLVSYKEMLDKIRAHWPDFKPIPNQPNDTSKAWKVPGFAGQVGFITSMTEHFCSSCNRMRLMADGNLKVCLFGAAEVSLRDALRSGVDDKQIIQMIRTALSKKKQKHADSKASKLNSVFRITANKVGTCPLFFIPKLTVPQVRFYSNSNKQTEIIEQTETAPEFTHLDEKGRAHMVDVGEKKVSRRTAIATATVRVGSHICKLISEGNMKKGNVLSVAQLAGIMAAKRTPELIPLCHHVTLDSVNVTLTLGESDIDIRCETNCHGRTGVEIEALTGATLAALTVYDMCKSVNKGIKITDIHVLRKTGGKSDYNLKYNKEPINEKETFAPVNFMYL